jgi:hypothetical protein
MQTRSEDQRWAPSPEEGARLVKAFHSIENAAVRNAIVKCVEELARIDN